MSLIQTPGLRSVVHLACAGSAAIMLGACSPDIERLGASTDRMPVGTTLVPPSGIARGSSLVPGNIPGGSIPAARAAPVGVVSASPLPAVTSGASSGARFAAPGIRNPAIAGKTARVAAAQFPTGTARNLRPHGRWTPEGGTPILVAQGETIKTMERRYGVPAKTLMAVNGITSASSVVPGTRLVIPVFNAGGSAASKKVASKASRSGIDKTPTASIAASRARPAASSSRRVVVTPPVRPLQKTAGKAIPVAKARPDRVKSKTAERLASRKTADSYERRQEERARKLAARKAAAEKAKLAREARAEKKRQQLAEKKRDRSNVRRVDGRKPARDYSGKQGADNTKVAKSKEPQVDRTPVGSTSAGPSGNFRWPARGRIIRGFKKGNNDGINIAVPEGAPIKAAEGGVIAYAGSELKGYGNLVLIRHSNGYVSAYAHNSALKVKRGDKVRRGQLIAKAGRTGNVSTPQLHFELRKGANPVNPVQLLGSN